MYIETAGRGPHVLLLHGTLEPPELLRFLAADLAHDHSIHLAHRTGHGRAGRVKREYAIDADLDALRDYLHDVGAPDYTVIGSGEGSYLAFALALDENVPVGSVLAIAPYAGNDRRYAAFARDVARRLPGDSGQLAGELRAFADAPSLVTHLAKIDTPIELLVGEEDERVSLDAVWKLATTLPNATLEVVPHHGHFLVAEDRERCIAACREATSAVRSATPSRGLTGFARDA